MTEPAPFFEVSLTHLDGQPIAPQRFRTVQDAMTAAEDYSGVSGEILFYESPDSEPVPVIVYAADGSIEVGDSVLDDDESDDQPWTDAEIEHNRRESQEFAEQEAKEWKRSSNEGPAMKHLNRQDFYAWAYDDLLTNTTRGVLAEYIVATALGIDDKKRREWANHDLEFEGVGIEVKSAAYVQAWEQDRPSEITFSIRTAHSWDDSSKPRAAIATRSAAVYVFCLLEGEDRRKPIDPLAVAEWTFYVLSTSELNRLVPMQRTIRLGRLEDLGARRCTYDDLKAAVRKAAGANSGS